METTYHFNRKQLDALLAGAIDMFLEYCDQHEKDADTAKACAVLEVLGGLDADKELVANDPTEYLHLQLANKCGTMRAHLEAIRDYCENPAAVAAEDMTPAQKISGMWSQAVAALA